MKISQRTASILKYLLAFSLLGFVLSNTGLEKIGGYMTEVSFMEGLLALTLASCAQLVSAMRMRFFFTAAQFPMSRHFAIILYYVGAFYNFLLPGGIGGDAYKVMLVRKRMDMPYMQGIRIMVADRASGLCIVMLTLFVSLYLLGFGTVIPYGNAVLVAATIITPVTYVVACMRLLKQLPLDMVGSLRYSLIAQLLWMATLVTLWKSIGHGQHLIEYIALYCAASIASLIPVSVGGLGLREMTYFFGAGLMQHYMGRDVNPDLGIALSLCMFAVTFTTSLPGLMWLGKAGKVDVTRNESAVSSPPTNGEDPDASTGNTRNRDWF